METNNNTSTVYNIPTETKNLQLNIFSQCIINNLCTGRLCESRDTPGFGNGRSPC